MDGGSEVCLEQEVERLRETGASVPEIANAMGVDEGWVEALVSAWEDSPESRG